MRITDIRCFLVEGQPRRIAFRWRNGLTGSRRRHAAGREAVHAIIRMETDEGIDGAVEIDRGALRVGA